MKKILKYSFYIVAIILFILLKAHVDNLNSSYFDQEFDINNFYTVISIFLSISVGSILGLKYIIAERNKEGKWKVNLAKLIIVGVPLLMISLYHIWIYNDVFFLTNIIFYSLGLISSSGLSLTSLSLFQVIFGYILVTSFYKKASEI